MAISDADGFEVLEHYLASLAQTVAGRENNLIPYRASDSLLFVFHRARITEPLYARAEDDDPPPYDKPYYTLCLSFATDDEDLWDHVADTLTQEVPFLRGDDS